MSGPGKNVAQASLHSDAMDAIRCSQRLTLAQQQQQQQQLGVGSSSSTTRQQQQQRRPGSAGGIDVRSSLTEQDKRWVSRQGDIDLALLTCGTGVLQPEQESLGIFLLWA